MVIDFSGTAGQVRETFHTTIHRLDVNGTKHIANMSDPRIPAALAPAVVGIVSLHDFRPHPMRTKMTTGFSPGGTCGPLGAPCEKVVPADLATIYNLSPLFSAGVSGPGRDDRGGRRQRRVSCPGMRLAQGAASPICLLHGRRNGDAAVLETGTPSAARSAFRAPYPSGRFRQFQPPPPGGAYPLHRSGRHRWPS